MSEAPNTAMPDPQSKPARYRKKWKALVALALPAAGLGGLIWALPEARATIAGQAMQLSSRLGGNIASAEPGIVRGVRVMQVKLTEQSAEKRFTGVIAARYETQIGFRVAGKIAERKVDVGQAVRRGDVLMTLDPADYSAALRAAEANRASAAAQKVQTEAEAARQIRLLNQGWTTRSAHDRSVASASSAAEQVKAATQQVELARNTLAYARLTAPEDGIVTAIRAEAGQVVSQGQAVLTLVRNGEREAVIAIPEGQIGDLASWSAQTSLWSQGDAAGPAKLREISPQADPTSRTHTARFTLPARATNIDLGATVTLTLKRSAGAPAATLPTSAVFFRNGEAVVWRVKPSGNRLEPLPVTIVTLGAERSIVTGVMDGDRIVTLGVHRIDADLPIRVVEDVKPAGMTP
jgi:membrane fusion protein, multidrug efflux system